MMRDVVIDGDLLVRVNTDRGAGAGFVVGGEAQDNCRRRYYGQRGVVGASAAVDDGVLSSAVEDEMTYWSRPLHEREAVELGVVLFALGVLEYSVINRNRLLPVPYRRYQLQMNKWVNLIGTALTLPQFIAVEGSERLGPAVAV